MTAFDESGSASVPVWRRPLIVTHPGDRSTNTPQTSGMQRFTAISGSQTGSQHLWMGGNTMALGQRSGDHHHGEADSGIYVVSGHPRFVFLVDDEERRLDAGPGDFVFVPAWVPHREENPSPDAVAVVVLARSTAEEIVINLPDLRSLDGIPQAVGSGSETA